MPKQFKENINGVMKIINILTEKIGDKQQSC